MVVEQLFSNIIAQAPWAITILIVLYYEFRHLRGQISGVRVEVWRLARGFRIFGDSLVQVLASKGVLDEAEAIAFRGMLLGFFSGTASSIREEWLKRVRELLPREELSYQEAQELKELAEKIIDSGDAKYEEAGWKLFMYASIMSGIALRKKHLGR